MNLSPGKGYKHTIGGVTLCVRSSQLYSRISFNECCQPFYISSFDVDYRIFLKFYAGEYLNEHSILDFNLVALTSLCGRTKFDFFTSF